MSATGNHFAVAVEEELARSGRDPARLAAELAEAEGLDGLLVVGPPRGGGAVRMAVYNADGSRAASCGNGLRCVAAFARARGLAEADAFAVETDAGPRAVELLREAGAVVAARVGLGRPEVHDERLVLGAEELDAVLVDLGNPHCVLLEPAAGGAPLERLGPALQRHPRFGGNDPPGVNVEQVLVRGRAGGADELVVRVWERGVGETAACGSGAGAVAAAAVHRGLAAFPLIVRMRGGSLRLERAAGGELELSGPVRTLSARASR